MAAIDEYLSWFKGGQKQYLFEVLLNIPGYENNVLLTKHHVRSTSIPESTFEEIVIPYAGLSYKMAGNRNYGDWTVSFNLDSKNVLLSSLREWHDKIFSVTKFSQESHGQDKYMRDQTFNLMDESGNILTKYKLISAWPKSVGAVNFDYASSDIATVDVTFSYQFYITNDGYSESELQRYLGSTTR